MPAEVVVALFDEAVVLRPSAHPVLVPIAKVPQPQE